MARVYLPGGPQQKLIKAVRSQLRVYGIRPKGDWCPIWQETWRWAHEIAISYYHTNWPSAREIAAQYVLLILTEMNADGALKLPYRATKRMTPAVAQRLTGGMPRLELKD